MLLRLDNTAIVGAFLNHVESADVVLSQERAHHSETLISLSESLTDVF